MKKLFDRILKCLKAARHEWVFGGPADGYIGKYSQQPFRIHNLVDTESCSYSKHMRYGGMLPSYDKKNLFNAYVGQELYNDGKNSFRLKRHAIDKYGRVRYFDVIPDGYIDVLENINIHDKNNVVNVFARKTPKWEYAGFLAEDE